MTVTHKPETMGTLPRIWQFLQKPLHEKSRSFLARWTKIFPNIPLPIRLPFGAWFVARNDGLGSTLTYDGFELAERSFVERFLQPGMTAIDVGAHHGFYTLLASKRVGPTGRVIAFEPSPREQRALRLNVRLNRCKNVNIQGLALGDKDTDSDLYVVEGRQTGFNSLRPPGAPQPTLSVRVRVARLDSALRDAKIDRVDFIKLDVEGGELEVLHGAKELLERRPRPLILAELQDVRAKAWGHRAKEVAAFLQSFGFRWFRPMLGGGLADFPEDQNEYDDNLVAVPTERMEVIAEMTEHGPRS